jgi:hypothetical protein
MTIGINVHRSGGTQTLDPVAVHFYLDTIDPSSLLGTTTVPPLAPGTNVVDSSVHPLDTRCDGPAYPLRCRRPREQVVEGSENQQPPSGPSACCLLPQRTRPRLR